MRRSPLVAGWSLGFVVLALAVAPDCLAQGARREGRALEFRTDLPWAHVGLEGNGEIDGPSPLRVPGPLAGDFWLVARGPGVETQRGRVRIGLDEAGSRLESHGGIPFRESFMRAALFPGYAQMRYGEAGKARLLGAAALAGLGGAIWAQTGLLDAEEAITNLENRIAASGIASERDGLRADLRDAIEERDFRSNRRNLFLGASAAVWGVNLLDVVGFGPDFRVTQADEASLTLAMERKTRLDAVLRSAVFPGLGQHYNGRPRKAALVGIAALGAGAHYLWRQDRYNESVLEFEQVRQRYEDSAQVEERTQLLAQQQALYDEVEDRDFDRTLAVGAYVGVWFLSVLDAAFDFGDPWGGTPVGSAGLGLSVEPSGAVAARVRF